ncbi:CPBP family intramembrane glutamic endopeptidase [Halosimplex amylolyticum]|uniref:CPBP family intramembrane glutamic endopeptidase n=1 Tax=Halosimplex amylolyticum TaxID=3396616 RepID=UPI003F549FD4
MTGSSVLRRVRSVRGSDLWGYLLFSHGWTWAWWSLNIVGDYGAFGAGLPFTVVGGAGPLLGGIVMSYVTYGRQGLSDLWARLTEIRRISPGWGIVTIAFFPLLAVLTGAVAALATDAAFVIDVGEFRSLLEDPSAFVLTALVILVVGPLPEEIGWRGYLLDRCQTRWSALTSGFAVGLVWAAWHAPLFLMPGYFANFDFAPSPVPFALNVLLISVVYTWVYDNTARSVLALIGFHFMENFVGQMTSLPRTAEPIGLAIRVLLVLGIVAWFGAQTFRRDGLLPSPPPRREP